MANSNSDSVTLIDTETLDILDTVPIPAFPEGYVGKQPNRREVQPVGTMVICRLRGK